MQIKKAILKHAIDKTHEKISSGCWSSANGKCYLAYHCFNTSTIIKIVDAANNCNNLRIAKNSDTSNENFKYIINDAKKYPEKYLPYVPSHIINHSEDDLNSFPDTPMHLISGFVKAIISQLILFLKRKSCYYNYFKMIAQDKTIHSLHSMKLSWLKVLPFSSEKFAGYACENYIHFAYLFKFIGMSLLKIKVSKPFDFPTTSQTKWTAEINRKWLSIRGLNTKGNAKSLRDRVATYMDTEQPIEVEKIHQVKVEDIIRMLVSCNICIHLLLTESTSKKIIERAHLCLLRALNEIHYVDQFIRANQKNPIWYVKYNLLCLLNCIENMEEYGPTKDRWEGSMEGEKCIQYLKKYFTGYHKKYQVLLHEKYNLRQSIENLKQLNNIESKMSTMNKNKLYVTYKNVLEITSSIMRHRPLSLIKFVNNIGTTQTSIGFVTKGNRIYAISECSYNKTENYAVLFYVKNFSTMDEFSTFDLSENDIEDYLIGIPYNVPNTEDKKLYYFVSKAGKELQHDMKLDFTYV